NKADDYTRRLRAEHPDRLQEFGLHALTNLILGNVPLPEERQPIYNKVYADRALRCSQTPYFGIYIVRALAQIGRWDKAVEMIRDYWGTMIQAGATSTWEEWLPTWQMPVGALPPQYEPPIAWSGLSLLQPAGAGPAQWLISEITGIKPEQPGFSSIRIEPHTAGLTWARGAAATPFGTVSSSWEITSSGDLEIEWDAPESCRSVLLVLPQGKKYRLDNKKAVPYSVKDGKAYFTAPAGKHVFKLRIEN
ncbi:MAG: hypothetical protein LBH19_08505, partial [Dysgonamonadaceae bacterium]|nr:hypothetical protein [Dysgonamonadaceae bacterium]